MSVFDKKHGLDKGSYRLEMSNSSFRVYDRRNNEVYYEDDSGYWAYKEYKGYRNYYFINSQGESWLKLFNKLGVVIYYEKNGEVLVGK